MGKWTYRSTFFSTSLLVRGKWSASRPGCFTPGEKAPDTYWIACWPGPRSCPDMVEERKFVTNRDSNSESFRSPALGHFDDEDDCKWIWRNWKDAVSFLSKYHPDIFLERLRRRKTFRVRTSGVLVGIRTEQLPNTSLYCYRYSNLLGKLNLNQTFSPFS
jgi:hypothetical protein